MPACRPPYGTVLFAVLLFILWALVPATTAFAGTNQWTSNGPYGGQVSVIAVDPKSPSTMYAAGFSGIFKTTDGALTWTRTSSGISDATIASIAIDPVTPSTLYAGSIQGGGLVKSTDGGNSWKTSGPTLVVALAIPAQAPTTIYAAQQQSGILKSTDGGATWSKVGVATLPAFPTFKNIVVDPANPNTLYAGETSKGVYKSTDGGATWAAANTGFTTGSIIQVLKLAVDPQNPATLYAAANTSTSAGLYKSTNGGGSWTQVFADASGIIGVQAVTVDPSNSANVYIGTFGQSAMKSTNGGSTFVQINTGMPKVGVNVVVVNPASPAQVYAGTQNGVFASSSSGGAWAAASAGLALTTITAVAVDPSVPTTIYAATKLSGLFKSVDGGESWQSINNGIGALGNLGSNAPDIAALVIDPTVPETLYAGTQGTLDGQVYKSTNGGANWTAAALGLPGFASVAALVIDPQAPAKVFAGLLTMGLYSTSDSGAHWSAVASVPATAHSTGLGAVALPATWGGKSAIGLSTNGDGIYVSDDGGASFASLNSLLSQAQALRDSGVCIENPAGLAMSMAIVAAAKDSRMNIRVPCGPAGQSLGFGEPPKLGPNEAVAKSDIKSLTKPTVTNWALPDGNVAQANACNPMIAVTPDPRDTAGFYVGSACGVLKGSSNGQQLVTMSAGLPSGLMITGVATTSAGDDVYAGAQSGGVWRFTPSAAPATPVPVVEFYNAALDHYFITWVPDEIAKLDAGTVIKGWARTGQTFRTYTTVETGTSPVCRFYIPPGLGDSHFFGRGTAECTATAAKNPTFVNEDPDFMNMFLPVAGVCPAGTTQVYRVFSNRPDANHRYMTDMAIRASMVAKGWLAEGDGADLVVMCAP